MTKRYELHVQVHYASGVRTKVHKLTALEERPDAVRVLKANNGTGWIDRALLVEVSE